MDTEPQQVLRADTEARITQVGRGLPGGAVGLRPYPPLRLLAAGRRSDPVLDRRPLSRREQSHVEELVGRILDACFVF